MRRGTSDWIIEGGLLIVLSFLWGSSFTLVDIAVETIPPATVVFGRLLIGAACLFAAVMWMRISIPRTRTQWVALTVQGLLQSALPFTLITWGQQYIDSGLAGLLNTTPPLFVFLIGFFWLRKRAAAVRKFAGIIVGFFGVSVVLGPAALAGDGNTLIGGLAITGASICYALAPLYAARFAGQPPVLTAACSMGMAALLLAPVSLIIERPEISAMAWTGLAAVAALGLLSTALAMAIYFRLVQSLGPLEVTMGSYLRAGFSVLLGALILGEEVTTAMVGGLVLIFLGVAVVALPSRSTEVKRS